MAVKDIKITIIAVFCFFCKKEVKQTFAKVVARSSMSDNDPKPAPCNNQHMYLVKGR